MKHTKTYSLSLAFILIATQTHALTSESSQPTANTDITPIGAVIFLILLAAASLILLLDKRKRCPKCNKKKLRFVSYKTLSTDEHYKYRRATYKCASCGHEITKDTRKPLGSTPLGITANPTHYPLIRHARNSIVTNIRKLLRQ
ncbi:MAG: hypothetical protein ACI4TR_01720 [Bacteroidaceae bacterium]